MAMFSKVRFEVDWEIEAELKSCSLMKVPGALLEKEEGFDTLLMSRDLRDESWRLKSKMRCWDHLSYQAMASPSLKEWFCFFCGLCLLPSMHATVVLEDLCLVVGGGKSKEIRSIKQGFEYFGCQAWYIKRAGTMMAYVLATMAS
jgi:hypothetical protein